MTTLVTGAAGFIGYHVARHLLKAGEQVVGIDNFNSYYNPSLKRARALDLRETGGSRFTCHEVDFADEGALDAALAAVAFDRIVHLGAQAGVRYSIDNPRAYISANLAGHLNMLEIARARRPSHFVYASSSSVYGGNDVTPFRISDRVERPVSLYAATKRADELLSETYAHLFRLPMTGLRFFTVYGPWGRPDMAMWVFTRKILAGEPIPVFNHGRMRRDFTYIDDIVNGVIAALERPPSDDGQAKAGGSLSPHAIYNLGNSCSHPLRHMIALLEQACGREAKLELLPPQPGEVLDTFADISESRAELGFDPKTTLEAGVPRFVDWFKEHFKIDRGAA